MVINFDGTPSGTARPEDEGYYYLAETVRAANHGRGRITLFLNTQFYMLPHGWQPPPGSPWEGHPERYARYLDPQPFNRLAIPYATDPDQIERRIRNTRFIQSRGHELASHGMRHDHGRAWTSALWNAEFEAYDAYMQQVVGITAPVGFRAPYLEAASPLFDVEAARGMRYDASRATHSEHAWPRRRPGTSLWMIGVPTIPVRRLGRSILSFDDSFRLRQLTDDEVLEAYNTEFDARYAGSRAPMIVASHGGYFPQAIRFARRVCRMPHVRCGSFQDLVAYLDAHPEVEGQHRANVRLSPTVQPAAAPPPALGEGRAARPGSAAAGMLSSR